MYFRYNDLDDLFKLLKTKCNKEDIKNLHLTSQRLKFLRTKNQREEAVRRFVDVLSLSENLMNQEEVDEFLKKGAFGIHWENEITDITEEAIQESDEDVSE